jgi:serine/threonine protein kinase
MSEGHADGSGGGGVDESAAASTAGGKNRSIVSPSSPAARAEGQFRATFPPYDSVGKVSESLVGSIVDTRYELRRLIARGGMGLVFEAHHKFTRRTVALKVLHDELRAHEEAHQRLLREALALTTVRHPGFVEVLDAGICNTFGPYVVLEMLEGRTLEGILAARGRLSIDDAVQVGRQVCEAVAYANARGVIHRDIKPSNVFVARTEVGREAIKIIDLGVAAVAEGKLSAQDRKLTTAHAVIGTPEYMAPEQLYGQEIDARTDVWGIGMTLFECVTGELPYAGSYPEVLVRVTNATEPPKVRDKRPDVPPAVAFAIETALDKEPSGRFRSAAELGRALLASSGMVPGSSTLLAIPLEQSPTGHDDEPERAIKLVRRKTRPGPADGRSLADDATAVGSVPRPNTPVTPAHGNEGVSIRRRQFVRAPYVTPVLVMGPTGSEMEARTEEISEEGMLVIAPMTLPVGAPVTLRFASPAGGGPAVVAASVRWAREGRGRTAIGVEFINAPTALRSTVAKYIATTPPAGE